MSQKPENWKRLVFAFIVFAGLVFQSPVASGQRGFDGMTVKKAIRTVGTTPNFLKGDAWRAYEKGYVMERNVFVCDNGSDGSAHRGAAQTVTLNQKAPATIIATASSRAMNVTGSRDHNYALYLDLIYTDGTTLWGQAAAFDIGSHDWQKREVVVFPEKPVKTVSFYMLFRGHAGKVWFANPKLTVMKPDAGVCIFDGVGVTVKKPLHEGFSIRDVAARSDFVGIKKSALGIELETSKKEQGGVTFFDVTITDTKAQDRAVTLIYSIPLSQGNWRWLHDPRTSMSLEDGREYMNITTFQAGANGRLSRYPLGAITNESKGKAIAIDMSSPAFYRIGCNASTRELFIAYDIGLTPEKPSAKLRFCTYEFDPEWQFRSALAKYYEIFSDDFKCRIKDQGLWMPFAKISDVKGWQDFGFKIKEGTNETRWDDGHDIITFRYTEPMTWWMKMPQDTERTLDAAMKYGETLAEKNDPKAKAWLSSAYHDEKGRFAARMLDTPWCDGAVWSINSMPEIVGEHTDFKNKWNETLRQKLYGPNRTADLDGEYIDSSEGYVTDELNFRRDHFAAAQTPLTFSRTDHKPAIFRGLIVFEYIRAIAQDVHGMEKLMMANSTPARLCWLGPLLDVMGTETNWNHAGKWQPMSDADMLYKRAICKGKPFCFLMNTPFENFSHDLVEKYMKRSLAYGMFPGFFSHNASQGHYFTRPELYERDRDLFKKYVPLCKLVAEAGWQPVTNARSNDKDTRVERFGKEYLTIFNSSNEKRNVTITMDRDTSSGHDLISGKTIKISNNSFALSLQAEDIAVIKFD